jgi:hypothetical protein
MCRVPCDDFISYLRDYSDSGIYKIPKKFIKTEARFKRSRYVACNILYLTSMTSRLYEAYYTREKELRNEQ